MRYTMTFAEHDYSALTEHLLCDVATERAAYLLCGVSKAPEETRLIAREVHPVLDSDVVTASPRHMSIKSVSFMRAMKRADRTKQAFVFVHSHPKGTAQHSEQDDKEESKLFQTAYLRIRGEQPHASIVLTSQDDAKGRVWLRDGSRRELDVIRVIGGRFRFLRPNCDDSKSPLFNRQVQAFTLRGSMAHVFATINA